MRQWVCWWLAMAWKTSLHRYAPSLVAWCLVSACGVAAQPLCHVAQLVHMHVGLPIPPCLTLLVVHVALILHPSYLTPDSMFATRCCCCCWLQLESGTVDDELAALKQGMLTAGSNGSSPVAALPEGRPVKDAIDMELEELRKKAKE